MAKVLINIAVFFSPHPFFRSPAAPSRLHSARVPVPICFTRTCGVGAGRRFCGALWMNGYPAVFWCEVRMDAWVRFLLVGFYSEGGIHLTPETSYFTI